MPKLYQQWECKFCYAVFTDEDATNEHERLHSTPRSFISFVYSEEKDNWVPSIITVLMSDGTVYEYFMRGTASANE